MACRVDGNRREDLGYLRNDKGWFLSKDRIETLESALAAAQLSGFPSEVYVADTVRKYKPAVEIYRGLIAKVGLESSPSQCWLVSGCASSHDVHAFCAHLKNRQYSLHIGIRLT